MTRSLSSIAAVLLACVASAQLPAPRVPAGNPITPEKVQLGKALFWDEQMSSTGTVSCGTCHMPEAGGGDSRAAPSGDLDARFAGDAVFGFHDRVTGRKAPSVIGACYSRELYWDGRAGDVLVDPGTGEVILESGAALENQILGSARVETDLGRAGRGWDDVIARLTKAKPLELSVFVPPELEDWIADRGYPELFQEVFQADELTAVDIAMAIATYERTLIPDQTPWDSILAGARPNEVLTEKEHKGIMAFLDTAEGRCGACHRLGEAVVHFSDELYHNTGLRPPEEDPGRFAVTGIEEDRAKFRTPRLRNVELRAPYMHDGSLDTLEDVIEFYDRGGDFEGSNKHPLISPIGLEPEEKAAMLAFIKRPLTDPRVAAALPPFDHPSQYADSDRRPISIGKGTPGTDGFIPEAKVIGIPRIGNSSITVAVDRAIGGFPAVLLVRSKSPQSCFPVFGGLIDRAGAVPGLRLVSSLEGEGAGQGWGRVLLPAPSDPAYVGSELWARWFVLDPGAEGHVSSSQALKLTWF